MEKEILMLNCKEFTKKTTGEKYYVVQYLRDGEYKQDFVSAIEFLNISKKAKLIWNQKEVVKQIGIFTINSFDKLYLSDIK